MFYFAMLVKEGADVVCDLFAKLWRIHEHFMASPRDFYEF